LAAITHHRIVDEPSQPRGNERWARVRALRARLLRTSGLAAFVVLVTALVAPGIASAHASYKSSTPKPNEILKTPPSVVTIHFVENVNPQGSDIVVYDATGKRVSTAPAQVDRADLTTMTVPMKGTNAEIYLVEWHTVSADDGDPDIGAFNFLVNPSQSSVQAVTGGSHPSTTSSSSSSGMPIWLGALLGVLGLIVGAGGWFMAQRLGLGVVGASTSSRRR
jgi:methionine-rich copper-binding protein CopC